MCFFLTILACRNNMRLTRRRNPRSIRKRVQVNSRDRQQRGRTLQKTTTPHDQTSQSGKAKTANRVTLVAQMACEKREPAAREKIGLESCNRA
jgi:hypothetical protein